MCFFSVRCFLETKNSQYIPGTPNKNHIKTASLPGPKSYLYISPEAQWLEVFQFPFFGNDLFSVVYLQYGYLPKIPMFCFFSQNSCNSGDHVAFVVSFWCQHQCFRSLCARVGFSHDRTPTLGMAWNFAGFKLAGR